MLNEQAFGLFWDSAARRPAAATGTGEHCMRQAKLRILRCTALAFKHEPGGLRFVPGSRPWLPGADEEAARAAEPTVGQDVIKWGSP